jgi:hypothetical protein
MKTALWLVVVLHLLVVIVNVFAFFILPFTWLVIDVPFWYSVFLVIPIESQIVYLAFNRSPCPLTRLENGIRKKLDMEEIGGFIGYYIIKQRWRK